MNKRQRKKRAKKIEQRLGNIKSANHISMIYEALAKTFSKEAMTVSLMREYLKFKGERYGKQQ